MGETERGLVKALILLLLLHVWRMWNTSFDHTEHIHRVVREITPNGAVIHASESYTEPGMSLAPLPSNQPPQ